MIKKFEVPWLAAIKITALFSWLFFSSLQAKVQYFHSSYPAFLLFFFLAIKFSVRGPASPFLQNLRLKKKFQPDKF